MRARIRALIIFFFLLVHGIAATPIPGSVKRSDFEGPIAEEEVARWLELLSSVGIEREKDALIEEVLTASEFFVETKKKVMAPVRPLLRHTGTGQAWGLFTYPNTYPHTMEISIYDKGEWILLFRANDPEHDWLNGTLRFRRMRGVYDDNINTTRPSYNTFVDWVAQQAWDEFPDAEQLRIRMVRRHVVQPGQPKDETTKVRLVRTRKRPA